MPSLNFKMGTPTSSIPTSGTEGEVFFTTDGEKYGHVYFVDGEQKVLNVVPYLLEIKHGGTGAEKVEKARQNINYMGMNPIKLESEDTHSNWKALGTGATYFNELILND